MPTPPSPISKQIALPRTIDQALQRAIGGHTGAHQRSGQVDRQRIVIQQIFRVRHQHVTGKAAVDGDAEEALLGAEVLVAVGAVAALAAADPGEDRLLLSDQILRRIGADFLDHARDLMAERERQRHAARGIELLAAAKVSVTILNVQVGMAQPATFDADENFLTCRLRCVDNGFAQEGIEFDQRLATHQRHGIFSSGDV
jgi:hypothetical protein